MEFTSAINPSLVPNWVMAGKMKQIRTKALATDCPSIPKQYQNLQPHNFISFKMKDITSLQRNIITLSALQKVLTSFSIDVLQLLC
jgi:hypothetical protein